MEFEKLQEIIANNIYSISKDDIHPDSRFIEDLGADSLDILQIVTEIEEEFNIEIEDDAIEKISTVQDAVDQIKQATA